MSMLRKTRCAHYGANRRAAEYRCGGWTFVKPCERGTEWVGRAGTKARRFGRFRDVRQFARRIACP